MKEKNKTDRENKNPSFRVKTKKIETSNKHDWVRFTLPWPVKQIRGIDPHISEIDTE